MTASVTGGGEVKLSYWERKKHILSSSQECQT